MALPSIELIKTPNGSFLTFTTDTTIPHCLKTYGGFELHLCQIAVEVFRRRGATGVLVDAGANIGTFSVPVALATGCSVAAFEAQRVVGQMLGANFLLNGIDQAWVRNVILAAPGHPQFTTIPAVDYSQPGNFGAYSVDTELFNKQSRSRMRPVERSESVPVHALDDFNLTDVFLIKLDVEGQELDVLKGSLNTLERNGFPALLFEAWRDDWWKQQKEELLGFIGGLGYEISMMDENFFAQHRTTVHPLSVGA